MPLITWCADIHLDHADAPAQERFLAALRGSAGEIVVICGDTSTSRQLVPDLERLAAETSRPLYFVLGNHDHFGSSIASVRDAVTALGTASSGIAWLPPAGIVEPGTGVALVGVDGWADGRHGNASTTPLRLNDDRLIAELAAQPDRSHRLAVKRALADADAARLTTLIDRAAATASHIVIATHVPPFLEALPRRGHLATPDWWPLLICGATGQAITEAAARLPEHRFTVLAGHTHVDADVSIGSNIRLVTAAARYGAPTFQVLEV